MIGALMDGLSCCGGDDTTTTLTEIEFIFIAGCWALKKKFQKTLEETAKIVNGRVGGEKKLDRVQLPTKAGADFFESKTVLMKIRHQTTFLFAN